jgi:hypothetical protein
MDELDRGQIHEDLSRVAISGSGVPSLRFLHWSCQAECSEKATGFRR